MQIKLQLAKISLIVPLNTVFRINVYIMWSIRSESSPFIKLTYYTFTICYPRHECDCDAIMTRDKWAFYINLPKTKFRKKYNLKKAKNVNIVITDIKGWIPDQRIWKILLESLISNITSFSLQAKCYPVHLILNKSCPSPYLVLWYFSRR